MLPRIEPYKQFLTKWCTAFSACHAIIIHILLEYDDALVSPYRIVILAFRYKGMAVFNRALNIFEICAALNQYGLHVRVAGEKAIFKPGKIKEIKDIDQYIGQVPIIATMPNHTVVIVRRVDDTHVEVVDSNGGVGYRYIHTSNFLKYFILNDFTICLK